MYSSSCKSIHRLQSYSHLNNRFLFDNPKPGRAEPKNHVELAENVRKIISINGNYMIL